jgi:hypothetical protein
MICLGDADDAEGILRLLDSLMYSDFGAEKKKAILENDFGIEMTKELDREVTEMCNYSKGVEQKGFEKGIEQGIEKGIVALIKTCKSFGASFMDTVLRVAENFDFSEERSKSEVEKYWSRI